jgi:putative hemolysin
MANTEKGIAMELALAARPTRLARRSAQRLVESPAIEVVWARHQDDVRAAQRLRYRVFAEEMGARLSPLPGTAPGHDSDVFDRHCEHLLVRLPETADAPARVVGTYRVLTPEAATRAGCFYSETEFDLTRLRELRPRMVELGRSCVDAEFRQGPVILALWGALTDFMHRNGLTVMIGCASVGMHDGGHHAASLWQRLRQTHLAPIEQQVRPRSPLPVESLNQDLAVEAPPLIKGYLRIGAKVMGPPAWDPDFNCADLPLIMHLADMPERYRSHFLRR